MKINLEFESISEMKKELRDLLNELYKSSKSTVDGYRAVRLRKPFESFEIEKLIEWTRQGKRPRWIALQLARTSEAIYAKLNLMRKDGVIPRGGRLPGRVKLNNDEKNEIRN